jgi:sporulation protein YlmC with PRC-barrel domain
MSNGGTDGGGGTRRLSELLGTRVVDAAGRDVGDVHDVTAVQDGPLEPGFGALLRVDVLRVGGSGFATRLGYATPGLAGPRPLKALFGWLLRHGVEVPWSMVERWDDDAVWLKPEWSRPATRR